MEDIKMPKSKQIDNELKRELISAKKDEKFVKLMQKLKIDDSILKGKTSKHIVDLLRNAGAKEVHMRVASPPFKSPCYLTSDTTEKEDLIAARMTVEEMREYMGADSLGFLSVESIKEMAKESSLSICDACFTGNYPLDVSHALRENKYSQKI